MNRRSTIFLSLIVLFILIFFILMNQNRTNRFDWRETYKRDSKQPYGTYVAYGLLQNYFKGENFKELNTNIVNGLPENPSTPSNYVFIGEGLYLDSAAVERLLTFVKNGNNAFISSMSVPHDLMTEYLYYEECNYNYWSGYEGYRDTLVDFNLKHPNLKSSKGFDYKHIRYHKTDYYYWRYISDYYFCEDVPDFVPIGKMNDSLVNFVQVPYGEGHVYLHTTPSVFANINLIDSSNLNYVNSVLAHLDEGDIYWDAFSKVPGESPDIFDDEDNSYEPRAQARLSDQTPLQYILSQEPLRWAWYLLCGLTLIYLIFRAKRRQRIIPVIPPNTNTSLEFVETIGQLYFQQNDHKKLAVQKMLLFRSFLREKYQINTQNVDETIIEKLAAISEFPKDKLEHIFEEYKRIEKLEEVSEERLVRFHLSTDAFYKNCK